VTPLYTNACHSFYLLASNTREGEQMITLGYKTIRDVSGLSESEHQRIYDFLQGAAYCWCKNRKHERFAMRNLRGGVNRDWDNIP
jgi:hypothetical protein